MVTMSNFPLDFTLTVMTNGLLELEILDFVLNEDRLQIIY